MNQGRAYTRLAVWLLLAGSLPVQAGAQDYSPVAVTGFTHDGIAEAGTDALAVTSTSLDLQDHIMYSLGFAATNAIASGLPDDGLITTGTGNYQLAPYSGNNLIYLSTNGLVANTMAAGGLTLVTPQSFAAINLLVFSTEGHSTAAIELNFTDGTTQAAGSFLVRDWFDGPNAVLSNYGRIVRKPVPPYAPDGLTSNNPRFYTINIPMGCTNHSKALESVSFVQTAGTTANSRLVVLALSGGGYIPLTATTTATAASCSQANGSIDLQVTSGTAPFIYSWNTSPVQTTAKAVNLPAGDYTCTVSGADHCPATYTETVPLNTATLLKAAASETGICSGASVALQATATNGTMNSYTWNPGGLTGDQVTVTPGDTTTYTVSGQDANGCLLSAAVTINVRPTPVADFTISPAVVCQGTAQTVRFTGVAGTTASYDWRQFDGATVNSGTGGGPFELLFNMAGDYELSLQVTEAGCVSDLAKQPVTVKAVPVATMALSRPAICNGDTVMVWFTGSAGTSVTLTWDWDGGAVQAGSGEGPFIVSYHQSAGIALTLDNGTCSVQADTGWLTVVPIPQAAFEPDQTAACLPATIVFSNYSTLADSYAWSFGDGSETQQKEPSHTYTTRGLFSVRLIAGAQGLCYDTLEKTALIRTELPPQAFFTASQAENTAIELHFANFQFTNESMYANYFNWDFGDGQNSVAGSPAHRYVYPGNYKVTLVATNDIGCVDSFSRFFYKIVPDAVLVIPNAFSPNGDGINEQWDIPGLLGFPDCEVQVYNRWGQPLFRSRGYAKAWDGCFKGQPVPVGTYYYIIKTPVRNYTGWVAVLR